MKAKAFAALAAAALMTTSFAVAGCSSSGGDDSGVVTVNGIEPQNPLVPTNTNENGGGRIIDRLFAGLEYIDANGVPHHEMAESIETTDRQHYKITLKPDWKFTDGSPVTAKSYVDTWNFAALGSNAQLQGWKFSQIAGYDDVAGKNPTAQTMSGLKVIDDRTFTIDLSQPSIDFELQLGFKSFAPMPEAAFKDLKAYGENPISNGPYKLAGPDAWRHNDSIELVANPDYKGNRKPKNKGLRFKLYQSLDTAYADLLQGNLDVLDSIPDVALPNFEKDLGDRVIRKSTARSEHIGVQENVPHFAGPEGVLRRKAISMAINREQICANIFHHTRLPARDFATAALPGFRADLPGSEVLKYNPEQAKKLWAQADAISPWSGTYQIAYNADGGNQSWVEAVANSVKNVLGVDAVGAPYPTFKPLRDEINKQTVGKAFRYGWLADYPSLFDFLTARYMGGSKSNNIGYNSAEFDRLLKSALASSSNEQSYDGLAKAQTLLFQDMPDIPIFEHNTTAGYAPQVKKADLMWFGMLDYENIQK